MLRSDFSEKGEHLRPGRRADREHRDDSRSNHFYRTGLPYTLVLSPAALAGYGSRFEEPRGSHRTPVNHSLDAQLQKEFQLFGSLSATVIGQVLNVLDKERPTTYFTNVASPTTVNTPSAFTRPRSYQVGFRLDF